jgi:signal transduction histidine kinase/ActR/RegA family two-component response regulator
MSGGTTPGGEMKIKQLYNLYSSLGDDPQKNIRMIARQACILLECACAMYHSIDKRLSIIESGPEFRLLPDLQLLENGLGRLCDDTALHHGDQPRMYTDFSLAPGLRKDPLIEKLGFRSGLGYPVRCRNQVVGALCLLDTQHRQYSDGDLCLGGILAKALSVEEERRQDNRPPESRPFGPEQRRLSLRLQQAQKMEAIATLAGGIAHQFNNALAVILGNLEMIQLEGLADAKLNRFVGPINQASQKMVDLTSQLLAYARGGKFQTQLVSAHRFVRDAVGLVNHSIAPNVELRLELDEKTDFIEVDTTQMQVLLAAIFSNASEAIENKGTIRLTLKNVDIGIEEAAQYPALKPGRHVLLQIADTGKGMEEQTRSRVFEPFFTTKFQGRGLGMAAVYGIVKMHGGYIYVDSEPGRGTTVSIYLPGIERIETAAAKPPQALATRSGTALIIEDEHLVMEINRAIVKRLGYHVLEARTGKEAVHLAQTYAGKIDFALLDVILPDMAGNQIYPLLIKARPGLKVIVCSGFSLDGPAREILNEGAERFLSKPFSVAALSSALDEIFKPEVQ